MQAVSLLPPKGGLTAGAAREWIEALSAEYAVLEQFSRNGQYLPLDDDDPAVIERAQEIRRHWSQLGRDIAALLRQIEGRDDLDASVIEDLRRKGQGAALRGKNDLHEMRRRHNECKGQPGKSVEEWRRELGLKSRR